MSDAGQAAADARFMKKAVALARRGEGRTGPNPMVGAVIVKGGRVVGRGYHRRAGQAHAEVEALADAGRRARGADLYVNLEPCHHQGKTPPCTRAIIDAGVRRVVVGSIDPNPLVDGRGLRALRRAGIVVDRDVLGPECAELNAAFRVFITERRAAVTFKTAVTLDGRVATHSGNSRWVSGEQSRRAGHRLRNTHGAIATGVGTVLLDDPQLTCRGIARGRDPIRVVVDSRLRTPPDARVVTAATTSLAPTLIVTTDRSSARKAARLQAAGAEVVRLAADGGRVSLPALLSELHARNVMSLLLEGGPTIAGAFWRLGLVDRFVAFVAPKVLADPRALPMIAGGAAETMDDATRIGTPTIRRLGDDVMISGPVLRG